MGLKILSIVVVKEHGEMMIYLQSMMKVEKKIRVHIALYLIN